MINLDLLQEKIDKLITEETSESLSYWLFKKRFPNVSNFVSDDHFVSIIPNRMNNIEFVGGEVNINVQSSTADYNHSTPFKFAA